MAKESISLDNAAKAFIILWDSGSYSTRELDIVLAVIRDSVIKSTGGPIVPDDEGPYEDPRQVERDRSPKEVIDTIIKADADETKAADEEHDRHLKAKAANRAEAAKAEKAEAAPVKKAPAKAKAKKQPAPAAVTPVSSGLSSTSSHSSYSGSKGS